MLAESLDFNGWATAYVEMTGPGDYSITMIDEGSPGSAASMETLPFRLPATADPGAGTDQDAPIIEAATDELADYGYVPVSDWRGSDGRFTVKVGITDWKMDELQETLYQE
ncbi:hypothetical protein [Streptomyces mirabilis]|uniref:hypothetical protein n=1 Tax=Streptomyces mirabilis TaxID=68239 RepID=UPI0036DC773D